MIVWGNFQVKRPFWTCKLATTASLVNGLCANVKRTAHDAVLFGEGISFLMGCSKNYIMYWGVTSIY